MIDNVSSYIETIILLIIAMTIIELLLPNSKNKKYVMFICSLIIMLSVINPIVNIFNSEFDISMAMNKIQDKMVRFEEESASEYDLENNIYSTYIDNLKDNMEKRLEDIGYEVLETKININKTTYEPQSIEMRVKYEDGYIQPIVIDVFENVSTNNLYEADIKKIKEILYASYGVDKSNIKINDK